MRKGLSFCLMLVMMLTMVWVPVSAEEQIAKIEIRTPEALPKAGEEFEVVAYISNNPGLCIFKLVLFAENDAYECVEMNAGEMFKDTTFVTNPSTLVGAALNVVTINPVEEDGVIATYKFVAKKDVEVFDFKVRDVRVSNGKVRQFPYTIEGATEVIAENPSKEEADEVPVEPTVTEHLYTDATGHWAEWYINSATEEGLFKGDEDGLFNPEDNVTRAQFVTVLWRMAGSPAVDAEVPFVDIDGQIDEFRAAIAWGYKNGFINGVSEMTFEPDGFLTREAAMKILHGYSGGQSGMEMMLASVYNGYFEDSEAISSWAKSSMWWGVYYKLIAGTTKTTISPQDTATRAQIAKILVNYINSTHIN